MSKRTPAVAVGLAAAVFAFPLTVRAQGLGDVFDRVKDAVVVIYTTQTDYTVISPSQPVAVGGLGSGVVVSPTQVLTAAHVVQAADQMWVEFTSGDTVAARVITSDQGADVAMLELSRPAPSPPAAVGNSDLARVGDQVFVVGAPLGQSHSMTVGYISARRQNNMMLNDFEPAELFQTDAAINQGNSGGPMFNMAGEVIGVVSHILSTSGGSQGLGYAVTSNEAMSKLQDPSSRYWGWELMPLRGAMARLFNLPPPHAGALVQRVAAGSAAEAFGVHPGVVEVEMLGRTFLVGGDIIIGAMGMPLGEEFSNLPRIQSAVESLMPGQAVTIRILRGGQELVLRGRPPT